MEDDLVAVTHECDYPHSVRDKPVLTRSVLSGASSGAEVDRHPNSRSEEHTSELQSRSDIVCRLLLEKKKYGQQKTEYNFHRRRTRRRDCWQRHLLVLE